MSLKSPTMLAQESFEFYKSHIMLLGGIALVPAALMVVVALLSGTAYGVGGAFAMGPVAFIGMVAVIVVSILGTAAQVLAIADPTGKNTVMKAYQSAKPYFLSYLLIAILSGITIAVGFLLFIVPGVVFAVWFCFTYFTLLIEGKKGIEAMKASKEHVRGMFLDVFVRLIVLFIIYFVIMFIVGFVFSMFSSGMMVQVATDIISVFIAPYALVYLYRLYQDVKANKVVAATIPPPVVV